MRTRLWNVALALGWLVILASMSAEAAAYRRPLHEAKVAAPQRASWQLHPHGPAEPSIWLSALGLASNGQTR